MSLTAKQEELVHRALDSFRIELPSWAFANTGTRFGKFIDPFGHQWGVATHQKDVSAEECAQAAAEWAKGAIPA